MGRMAADIVGYGEESGWTEQLQKKKMVKENPLSSFLLIKLLSLL